MDPPLSPMEPIDPQRIREMVVDKQGVPPGSQMSMGSGSGQHWSPAHMSQGNTASPASVESPHSLNQHRLSSGSTDSPFQNRPSSQQPQQFDFNLPRTPMYPGSTASPTKPVNQHANMMSPVGRSPQQPQSQQPGHPPASPFPRTSSAASSTAGQSPFPQPSSMPSQQPYQSPMYPANAYPQQQGPRMAYPGQQQAYGYPQNGQQWPGQSLHPAYVGQPRMIAQPHPTQRPIMRYPPGAYQQPGQHVMYQTNRPVRPVQYQQPGTPQTPTVPQSPAPQQQGYPAQYSQQMSQQAFFMQQQRMHQQNAQSSQQQQMMRSQYIQQLPPATPGPAQPLPNGQQLNVRYVPNGVPQSPAPVHYAQQPGPQAPPTPVPPQQLPQTPQSALPSHMPPDMRPPQLMSPSQAQMPPIVRQQHLQQHSTMPTQPMYSNMHQMYQPIHMQQPGMMQRMAQPVRTVTYFGHDPNSRHRLNDTETFLAGCVFLFEGNDLLEPTELHNQLRYYGADVETVQRNDLTHLTHIVCDQLTQRVRSLAKTYPMARLVTTFYLNDCLEKRKLSSPSSEDYPNGMAEKRKLDPPYKAPHLPPAAWDLQQSTQLPGYNRVFSSEGFDESEVAAIKFMCKGIGARYNGCFTKNHAALVSKGETGRKSIKASEWDIPVVNYMWLVRLYFGNTSVINDMKQQEHNAGVPGTSDVITTPHMLEKISEHCMNLLIPWRTSIPVNDLTIQRAFQTRNQVEQDVLVFPHNKFKFLTQTPTEEQISKTTEILQRNGRMPNVRIFFDRFPAHIIDQLSARLRCIGGQMAESIVDCTHFVTPDLRRTLSLCEALALGKEIVEPSWIDHSFSCLKFVDSIDFRVRDPDNERKFGFNVLNTIFRARKRQSFEDVTFHLSQTVQPSFESLQRLIQMAGGTIKNTKPTYKEIAHYLKYDKTFLIIVNENDLSEYEYLWEKRIPLFNEEFVFMSILRHELDTSMTYRLNQLTIEEPHVTVKTPIKQERVKGA